MVQQRRDVSLDDEEEQLLGRDRKQRRPDNNIWRVGPDIVPDEIAVPGNGGYDGYEDEDESLVPVAPGKNRVRYNTKRRGQGNGEFEMAVHSQHGEFLVRKIGGRGRGEECGRDVHQGIVVGHRGW